jgi:hypothetical protein
MIICACYPWEIALNEGFDVGEENWKKVMEEVNNTNLIPQQMMRPAIKF